VPLANRPTFPYWPASHHFVLRDGPIGIATRRLYSERHEALQMTKAQKEFFQNQSVELSEQVTEERLRKAGVRLADDLGLKPDRSKPRPRFPAAGIKKLAGG
jgi:hypothetical protein